MTVLSKNVFWHGGRISLVKKGWFIATSTHLRVVQKRMIYHYVKCDIPTQATVIGKSGTRSSECFAVANVCSTSFSTPNLLLILTTFPLTFRRSGLITLVVLKVENYILHVVEYNCSFTKTFFCRSSNPGNPNRNSWSSGKASFRLPIIFHAILPSVPSDLQKL